MPAPKLVSNRNYQEETLLTEQQKQISMPALLPRGLSANAQKPPKPMKRNRAIHKPNADLVELNEWGGVGDQRPDLANGDFIDKIKAKLDMLEQM